MKKLIPILMLAVVCAGCVSVTDITNRLDHPAVKGNPYCVKDAIFTVQVPLMVSPFKSDAGFGLYPDCLPPGQKRTDFGADKRVQAKGFLRPRVRLQIERAYWVKHFDVGDHVEIRARVLDGELKGTPVSVERVQDKKFLRPIEKP